MSNFTAGFSPKAQNVTFFRADGVTPVVVAIADINEWYHYNTKLCINYASQLGACLIMLVVTAVLTKKSKRLTPIFIFNMLSLLFGVIRALLLVIYSVSPWAEFYAYFTLDWSAIEASDRANSVAGTIMPLAMTVTVNLSLGFQAYTVVQGMNNKYTHMISSVSGVVFLLAVGFRFAQVVTNSLAIMVAGHYFHHAWITVGTLATETISIWYYSIIFTSKLLWTIYARKNMGLRKWSYIQILAAMGGCTMIIPSAFAVLQYATPDRFPEAGTLTLTMVALLLPLSSLWASMVTTHPDSEFNVDQLRVTRASRDAQSSERKTFTSMSTYPSYNSMSRKGSDAPIRPTTINNVISRASTRDSTELDLEMLGVRVDRSYSVHSGV